jgi:putative endonuclease
MKLFKTKERGVGEAGEDTAVKFLKKKRYKILERNWFNRKGKRLGEIDIIAKDGETIVFVEVKTREMKEGFDIIPEEQITPVKLHKLQRAAECYIGEKNQWNSNWRFDAVSVYMREGKVIDVKHIENIFI